MCRVIRICFLVLFLLIICCHQKTETNNIEIIENDSIINSLAGNSVDILTDMADENGNTPTGNHIDIPVSFVVPKDIFVAGSYENTDDYVYDRKTVICYWENGERTDMDIFSITDEVQIRAIAVSNGVVYAAGFYKVGDGNRTRACYWVNGKRINLDVPRGARSIAFAIAASGDTAYVAGYYDYMDNQTHRSVACYWQNGERTDLLDIPAWANEPYATGITVADGAVYVTGSYKDNNYNSTPCYWENGKRTDIAVPNGVRGASVSDIVVSDGIVYLAGEYNTDSGYRGYYCVDGTSKNLGIPKSAESTDVTGIAVIDGNVYVTGSHSYGDWGAMETYYTACYWKNGERIDLGPANHSRATDIAVLHGQSYISGYFEDRNTRIACCWINGVRMELPVPNGNIFSYANAITAMGQ